METLKAIATRKSIRRFLDKKVSDETVHKILAAGMSGPSATNARPWAFLVVTDTTMLERMADCNGKYAGPLRGAAFAVLVCGDTERFFKPAPEFWSIDAAIAAQNMILAAHDLGVGSVWLGTYPIESYVRAQAELFHLPRTIVPHSIIAFGYPEDAVLQERNLYKEKRIVAHNQVQHFMYYMQISTTKSIELHKNDAAY